MRGRSARTKEISAVRPHGSGSDEGHRVVLEGSASRRVGSSELEGQKEDVRVEMPPLFLRLYVVVVRRKWSFTSSFVP